jgi:hypothetical protein
MTLPLATISRKYLGVICLFVIAVILIAGLWPFDFNPVNKVEWLQNGNGIRFYGQGTVVSRQPMNFGTGHSETASISIEILVLPHEESTNTVASIVTLYDHERETFMVGQWLSELIIRVPAFNAEQQKHYREIGIANALTKDVIHFIALISDKESTAIYIDGTLNKIVPRFSLLPVDKELSGVLILGNSPDGTHEWNGSFFGLSFYNKALGKEEVREHYLGHFGGQTMPTTSYLFNERSGDVIHDHSGSGHNLIIPQVFQPLQRTVLEMPEKILFFSSSNLKDIAINVIGFIPFGFYLSAWLRFSIKLVAPRAYLFSIVLGALISFAIELTQVYLPTRDSSLMDVFSNILGTAIGLYVLDKAHPIFRKITPT